MTQIPPNGRNYPNWPGTRPFKETRPADGTAYPGGSNAPQGPVKKGPSGFKAGLLVLAVLLGCTALAAVAGETGQPDRTADVQAEGGAAPLKDRDEEPSENQQNEVEEAERPDVQEAPVGEKVTGPAFQGRRDTDAVALPGEMLASKRVGYATAPLQQASSFGTRILCATVAIANQQDSEVAFGFFEWELQDPKGVILTPTFLDGGRPMLTSLGELAPGGSVQGDVCFESDATALPGDYILFREESSFFSNKRMAWVNSL